MYDWSLLIYCSIWTFGAVLCPGTWGSGAWQALFLLRVQCMGICCRLGPGLYLQSGFTSEGLTLVGFNSIILLFIFNLSHVLSFHVSFYAWLLCDWVVFMIPFYILCHFINCNCFFFKFYFTILYWFCYTSTWIHHECTRVPHPEPSPTSLPILPSGSSQCTSILYPASNLDWWFVSYMILYLFQCHSPKSSHPHHLPQSPKDCSIHLCLFCCLTYRVIVTIFLNSIYMR